MFDLMIQQAQAVATAGLSRAELTGLVDGAGRAIAAMTSLQTRCATGRCRVLLYAVSYPPVRLW